MSHQSTYMQKVLYHVVETTSMLNECEQVLRKLCNMLRISYNKNTFSLDFFFKGFQLVLSEHAQEAVDQKRGKVDIGLVELNTLAKEVKAEGTVMEAWGCW